MMDRRIFLGTLAGGLLTAPLAAEAQRAGKVPRVGFLSGASRSDSSVLDEFRQGLRELGYVEGQNIAIESRWAEGEYDRLPGLAAELVRLKVDVMAVLANPANPGNAAQLRQAEVVARALGMRLQPLEAHGPSEIDRAFAAMTRERAGALLVLLDPILAREREQIADLAAKGHLPAMYALRLHVDVGGLMAYGANIFDLYRRTAIYVDKILKGAKPGDLPVEQATKFELVINLKTAKALGLTIPPSLLQRADQVIE